MASPFVSPKLNPADNTCFVVLGASGDLAFKKTYPALFGLFKNGYLPKSIQIVGYARSELNLDDFKKRISSKIQTKNDAESKVLSQFLALCTYVSGKYDQAASFKKLNDFIQSQERGEGQKHRVFYLALPPSVFISASKGLKEHVWSPRGSNRLVVEKPFGKDFESCRELSQSLANDWKEDEIYRIDHYLGKEMVKNLMILRLVATQFDLTSRFANVFFGAIWNRNYIHNVQITFKETIGTEGRGGYFDEFGIIRDVMQNHLLQILTIVAMARPATLDAEDVRNEKVKVLRAIRPLTVDDVLLGQYVKSADGQHPGYLEDPGVPANSVTPTYAAAVFMIRNERWDALNEAKAEIRIQFQDVPGEIYPSKNNSSILLTRDVARNELVVRVQPNEAVYMKFMNKEPGLSNAAMISELDLNYKERYSEAHIPDAYESLVLDVLRGDKSNFVRVDELDAAWRIFTPLLHHIEKNKVKPLPYEYGSRGPESINQFVENAGYRRTHGYVWKSNRL